MLAADARELLYRRWLVSCRCGRCLVRVSLGFPLRYGRRRSECQRRGQTRKKQTLIGLQSVDPTQTVDHRLCCSRCCACVTARGPGVGHASCCGDGLFFLWVWLLERLSSRRYRIMRACQRRYASPSSPSCPSSGFKQLLELIKECLHCLNECVSSW